jgi:DNA-binding response OmpR family regulator
MMRMTTTTKGRDSMEPETRHQHILVCDDDHALRAIFKEFFADEGYRVTVQASILDGVNEVVSLAPDLIVLDLIFGGEPMGFDFLRSLKTSSQTKSIPVLVCTAAAILNEEIKTHLTTWECASVTKPFEINELIEAVRECLGKKEVAA